MQAGMEDGVHAMRTQYGRHTRWKRNGDSFLLMPVNALNEMQSQGDAVDDTP